MDERYSFGAFTLTTERGVLLRDGVPVPLGYRAVKLLTELVRRAGHVVSKAELLDAAWPSVAVEEGNLTVQIAAVRRALSPSPGENDWISTIPRVGYRFSKEVSHSVSVAQEAVGPSVAVLPFVNIGRDEHHQHFADGLAEDLITRLARLRWLFVSGRNSSFTFRSGTADPRLVGRELGVRYVLTGSIRGSERRLRVIAEIDDCTTGGQIWSGNFDVKLDDFLTLQDQIAERVVAVIEPRIHLVEHERIRNRPDENLDAWGCVMRAMPGVWTWGSPEEMAASEALLEKAVRIEPAYPRANSLLAWIHAARIQLGWSDDRSRLAEALEMAEGAMRLDRDDPWAHLALGYVHMVSRTFDAAESELLEAIDLNPSFALAHVILGCTYGYGGLAEDGLHQLAIATRLSPRDFAGAANHATRGLCHLIAERYDQAIAEERRAVVLRPHFGTAWRTLAAAAGLAGDKTTAEMALTTALRLHPALNLEWIERYHPIVRPVDRERYARGLREAGLR